MPRGQAVEIGRPDRPLSSSRGGALSAEAALILDGFSLLEGLS
ncbi:MAG: hypothetical protein ACOYNR_15740 [Blastocatellia bacterium]|jgi:hypothetical protein